MLVLRSLKYEVWEAGSLRLALGTLKKTNLKKTFPKGVGGVKNYLLALLE